MKSWKVFDLGEPLLFISLQLENKNETPEKKNFLRQEKNSSLFKKKCFLAIYF